MEHYLNGDFLFVHECMFLMDFSCYPYKHLLCGCTKATKSALCGLLRCLTLVTLEYITSTIEWVAVHVYVLAVYEV